jgi:hypothetical protein
VSDITIVPSDPPNVDPVPGMLNEKPCQETVFIAAQTVRFSTAAATPLPRTFHEYRLLAVLRAWFAGEARAARAARREDSRRHFPPRRDAYLEQAAMSREMYRL